MKVCQLYAVIGDPILHSRSPLLFSGAFRRLRLRAAYTRLASDSAGEAIALAKELGLAGFNITSPYKQEIAALVDRLDDVAAELDAVNTVMARDGRLEGFNTDPPGLLGALRSGGFSPAGKRAVVIGAGGAAKAAAYALRQAGAAHVLLANRTPAKAEATAALLGCEAAALSAIPDALRRADLLISCLPAHINVVESDWLDPKLVVLDANYAASPLSEAARARGCRVISGLAWLLHQALASFRLFTGRRAPAAEMEAALNRSTAPRDRLRSGVALIGFMGAGKTTVGQLLAARLGVSFRDLYQDIERSEGRSVAEIFRTKGEAAFRKMEREMLADVPFADGEIVACGGGVIHDPINRRRLRKNAVVIWLSAPLETCLSREVNGARPLLADAEGCANAGELLARRTPFYAETADLVVDTGRRSRAAVVKKIADELREA